jgi:hypothetical protein
MKGAAMSELENVKPVAFYRADWKGDMVFRKNNTIDVRKNESDFTKGWIKPLYDEIPEQPQLTIPKSIAESKWMKHLILCSSITQFEFERYDFLDKEEERVLKWVNTGKNENILYIYLASKRIGVDLVKVVEG